MAKLLNEVEIKQKMGETSGWERMGTEIKKKFKFKSFVDALRFVNLVGERAEGMDHHPDILIHNYKFVTLTLTTHQATDATGQNAVGLTVMDFELAKRVDQVWKDGKFV